MDYKHIKVSIENGIAHILLNRPDVLNALNRDLVTELGYACDHVSEQKALVVIISGKGGNFAAGADVAEMVEQNPLQARSFSFNPVFNKLEELRIPVIAAISGYALGGGLELALACDFRICSKDAKLGLPEIKLGIFPGAGGTQRLPRLIGTSRAKEIIFLGQPVDAEAALGFGLCSKVAEGDPVEAAMELAETLKKRPGIALAYAKQAIHLGGGTSLKEGIEFEAALWADLFSTDDQKEGMKAFLEKRKPVFNGK
ncbi:MAG: hypothetical protein GY754_10940 [bacterium]|nr:hypothetical protein [bacterium]